MRFLGNESIPDIGTNLSTFEHAPDILGSPLCAKCDFESAVQLQIWAPISYQYVYVIVIVTITLGQDQRNRSLSTFFNPSTFSLNESFFSTIVNASTADEDV